MPNDALYKYLGNIQGMNLWTGSKGETQDLDYKHNFKHLCKLLCTQEDILINNVIINNCLLALWFEKLVDVDWSEIPIYSLLNPDSVISNKIYALLSSKDA